MLEWHRTDEYQFCLQKTEESFEYAEIIEAVGGKFTVRFGMIDWDDYSTEYKLEAISTYGYKTFEELEREYSSEWKKIVIECIFESNSDYDIETEIFNTEEEALNFLKRQYDILI